MDYCSINSKPEADESAPDARRDEDVSGIVLEVHGTSARRSNEGDGVLSAVSEETAWEDSKLPVSKTLTLVSVFAFRI